ncbi:MAG: Subtilisin DY, partial [Deltaproteobacteria bacterium]|nr:Subtilisin DY [Deltaproteobacteria bacterium]
MSRILGALVAALLVATTAQAVKDSPIAKVKKEKLVGITILVNAPLDAAMIDALAPFGDVINYFDEIDGVVIKGLESDLAEIRALPFVLEAGLDSERLGGPFDSVGIPDVMGLGYSTWDLDAINVTNVGYNNRVVDYDGTGVYVAVIDTGLIHTWRMYFPEDRIATEYGIAFEGGGGDHGFVTDVPNLWERDVNSHGTHVTSTIL